MKKLISVLLVIMVIISSLCTFSVAASGIKIQINGQNKVFDVMPQIINGRTLVPMRAIFEEFGADIQWEEKTRTVKATVGDTTVTLIVNYPRGDVNGNDVQLDVPPKIINGRTMVPVRFIAEALGCKVDWDGNSQTVIITGEIAGGAGNTTDNTGNDLSLGEMESMEYKNPSLGIGFRLPSGWAFRTREEINELYGYVSNMMDIDDYMNILESNGSYIDMMASGQTGDNIQVAVTKGDGLTVDHLLNEMLATMKEQVESYGFDVKQINIVEKDITNGRLKGVYLINQYQGVTIYQLLLLKKVGNNFAMFTISASTEASVDNIARSLFAM